MVNSPQRLVSHPQIWTSQDQRRGKSLHPTEPRHPLSLKFHKTEYILGHRENPNSVQVKNVISTCRHRQKNKEGEVGGHMDRNPGLGSRCLEQLTCSL